MSITRAKLKELQIKRQSAPVGREIIDQVEHVRDAGARLVMGDVKIPGDVLTDDVSNAGVFVQIGSILRIQTSADTYVAFGESDIAAVDSSTTPAIKLDTGYHLVVATDSYVRASAAFTRLEVIKN